MKSEPPKNVRRDEKGRFVSDLNITTEQKDKIVDRYRKGESCREIAKDFVFSKTVVLRVLKKADCGIRFHNKIEFTDKQVEEMVMMYQHGFSSREIADWFGVGKNTPLRVLREAGCEIRPPSGYIKRDIPEPWTGVNAAYVFGILIADAHIKYFESKKGKTPSKIVLNTPDREFVVTFSNAVKSAFGIQTSTSPHGSRKNAVSVRACSVDLGRSYNRFKWRLETWRVPEPFFNAPEEVRIALCQGKFDSDGFVDRKAIAVKSIHKQGLEDLQRILKSIGYKTSLTGPHKYEEENRQDQYTLRTSNASLELLRLPRKRKKLARNQN